MVFCKHAICPFCFVATTNQVLETVPAIKKYSGSGPDAFPHKPGAARELTNPALEFIKSLCRVLSLDPTVVDEVRQCGANPKIVVKQNPVGSFSRLPS